MHRAEDALWWGSMARLIWKNSSNGSRNMAGKEHGPSTWMLCMSETLTLLTSGGNNPQNNHVHVAVACLKVLSCAAVLRKNAILQSFEVSGMHAAEAG